MNYQFYVWKVGYPCDMCWFRYGDGVEDICEMIPGLLLIHEPTFPV